MFHLTKKRIFQLILRLLFLQPAHLRYQTTSYTQGCNGIRLYILHIIDYTFSWCVIAISTDDYHNKAKAFSKQTGLTFENVLDSKLLLKNMLGTNTFPLTILVDDDGRVLEKVRGPREWDSPETIAATGEVFRIKLIH